MPRKRLVMVAAVAASLSAGEHAEAADAAPASLEISETRWLAPDADIVAFLSMSPGECLRPPEDDAARYLVEVGRAAFRSPLLFGGPAARGGLSCNSCHRDGRDNPDFFLAGLSAAPGTADVTSSLFSASRDDAVFNPLPIPTLIGAGAKASFGTRKPAATLHDFVAAAVVEEFQGAKPSPAVIDGVAAYVAHMDAAYCPSTPARQTPELAMGDAVRALNAAAAALARGDRASADFLIVSAQRAIGAVHERFSGPKFGAARKGLVKLAREIGAIRSLAATDATAAAAQLGLAGARAVDLAKKLNRRRGKSLYDADALRRALDGA